MYISRTTQRLVKIKQSQETSCGARDCNGQNEKVVAHCCLLYINVLTPVQLAYSPVRPSIDLVIRRPLYGAIRLTDVAVGRQTGMVTRLLNAASDNIQ